LNKLELVQALKEKANLSRDEASFIDQFSTFIFGILLLKEIVKHRCSSIHILRSNYIIINVKEMTLAPM